MNPPKLLVALVRFFLPRDCGETILGDLHERYQSPSRYILDAAGALPGVFFGRILRATPLPFLVQEGALLYAAYFLAAFRFRHAGPPNLLQVLFGTLVLFAAMRLRDVYRGPFPIESIDDSADRRLKLVKACLVAINIFLVIYFSDGLIWFYQPTFKKSHLFPGIMTRLQAVQSCPLAICPLRIWLDVYRKDRPQFVS